MFLVDLETLHLHRGLQRGVLGILDEFGGYFRDAIGLKNPANLIGFDPFSKGGMLAS